MDREPLTDPGICWHCGRPSHCGRGSSETPMFTQDTFDFLRDLRANNRKDWFEQNRARYERHAKAPLLQFVQEVRPHLAQVSRHYAASEASVFRLHRDLAGRQSGRQCLSPLRRIPQIIDRLRKGELARNYSQNNR